MNLLPSKQFVQSSASNAYRGSKWYLQVGNKFDRAHITPRINAGMQKFGGLSKAVPTGFNELGLTAGLSVFMAQQSFDPTQHDSRLTHIGKNFVASSVDSAAFMVNPLLGLGIMAANFAGMPTPGDVAMHAMDAVSRSLDFNKYGRKTVAQNERTMRATSANMALIGQGGNHAVLGNEAMIMHN